jgi:hypothetical protein
MMKRLMIDGEYIDNFSPAYINPYLMSKAYNYTLSSFLPLETIMTPYGLYGVHRELL